VESGWQTRGVSSSDPRPDEPGRIERGKAHIARVKARAVALREQAEARRSSSAFFDVGFIALEHDGLVGGGILAGAVAFRIFLFVVPFVFVLVAGFGLAADAANESPQQLAKNSGITGILASTIKTVDNQSFGTRLTIFLVGGYALIVTARTLVLVLNAVHVLVWRLPRTRLARQARATFGLLLVVVVGLILLRLESSLRELSPLLFVVDSLVSLFVLTVVWTWASLHVFPHPVGMLATDVLPGALFVAVGFEAMRVFTVTYVSWSFEHKSETYGAIGGSLTLLLWAYVLGRIIAASVVLNAAYWLRRHGTLGQLPPPPPPRR
jgi:uncharacterized BrkB/YihY/UPF0761 family membrane protein